MTAPTQPPADGSDDGGRVVVKRNERAAQMAATWWGERLQSGDRGAFEAKLFELVYQDLSNHGYCRLDCDYDPEGHLLTAVRASGVECTGFLFSAEGILPQKHSLGVFRDRLEPKEGYGNWKDDIMVAP